MRWKRGGGFKDLRRAATRPLPGRVNAVCSDREDSSMHMYMHIYIHMSLDVRSGCLMFAGAAEEALPHTAHTAHKPHIAPK